MSMRHSLFLLLILGFNQFLGFAQEINISEVLGSDTFKFDLSLIRADKEIASRYFTKEYAQEIIRELLLQDTIENYTRRYTKALTNALRTVYDFPKTCDMTLYVRYKIEIEKLGGDASSESLKKSLVLLRFYKIIDDLLYDIILSSIELNKDLKQKLSKSEIPIAESYPSKKTRKIVEEIYTPVADFWPNGVTGCSSQAIGKLLSMVQEKFEFKKMGRVVRKARYTSLVAYQQGLISLNNYIRINTYLDHGFHNRSILLQRYLDNLFFAKNKLKGSLTSIRGEDSESIISSQMPKETYKFHRNFVKRKGKITKRKDLYRKYNSTQIMLLADIMVKAAKRINAFRSHIEIYYVESDRPDEIYNISPMEQYRMALSMLQKDMNNLRVLESFENKYPTYDDVIVAAFETGVFSNSELDMIISYEEFWNRKVPTWKKVAGFTFSLAGTASFYLPPPWNVIGAIGLVFAQTKLAKSSSRIDSTYNSNSIF